MVLTPIPAALERLRQHLDGLSSGQQLRNQSLAQARAALLVQLGRDREALLPVLGVGVVADIEGRLTQVAHALEQRNVLLLTKGALEHYLLVPLAIRSGYGTNKRYTVDAETAVLARQMSDGEMSKRYGGLHSIICKLPGKEPVEVDTVLTEYLSRYIVELQNLSVKHPKWGVVEHGAYLTQHSIGKGRLFELRSFERRDGRAFSAVVAVRLDLGQTDQMVGVFARDERRNEGIRVYSPHDGSTKHLLSRVFFPLSGQGRPAAIIGGRELGL